MKSNNERIIKLIFRLTIIIILGYLIRFFIKNWLDIDLSSNLVYYSIYWIFIFILSFFIRNTLFSGINVFKNPILFLNTFRLPVLFIGLAFALIVQVIKKIFF